MSFPDGIRSEIRDKLWAEADKLRWLSLSAADKARYYSIWTETTEIGGRLAGFMDPRQVRVYIKDTLLKSYARERTSDAKRILRILALSEDVQVAEIYIKPHGRRLLDGRQIAWSRASAWKATLMALHQRSFVNSGVPFAAVLSESSGKFSSLSERALVEDASAKLRIQKLIWLD